MFSITSYLVWLFNRVILAYNTRAFATAEARVACAEADLKAKTARAAARVACEKASRNMHSDVCADVAFFARHARLAVENKGTQDGVLASVIFDAVCKLQLDAVTCPWSATCYEWELLNGLRTAIGWNAVVPMSEPSLRHFAVPSAVLDQFIAHQSGHVLVFTTSTDISSFFLRGSPDAYALAERAAATLGVNESCHLYKDFALLGGWTNIRGQVHALGAAGEAK